jgi:hypothetical protein
MKVEVQAPEEFVFVVHVPPYVGVWPSFAGGADCGAHGPAEGGPVHSSGGYHLPSDANHHPGP